jgi:hypothetical protein
MKPVEFPEVHPGVSLMHVIDGHEYPCFGRAGCAHCKQGDQPITVRGPGTQPAVPLMPFMTLRDWYAGHALAGIIAAHTGEAALPASKITAKQALEYADALLLARQQLDAKEGGESS